MSTIRFAGYEFTHNPVMDCLVDAKQNKLVFLSKNDDEIHLVVELQDQHLVFHPRWNVKILTDQQDPKQYMIDVNFEDESFYLKDLSQK